MARNAVGMINNPLRKYLKFYMLQMVHINTVYNINHSQPLGITVIYKRKHKIAYIFFS